MLVNICKIGTLVLLVLTNGSPETRAKIVDFIRYDWIKYGHATTIIVKSFEHAEVVKSGSLDDSFLENVDFVALTEYAQRYTKKYPGNPDPSLIHMAKSPVLYDQLNSGVIDVGLIEKLLEDPRIAYRYIPWLRDFLKMLMRGVTYGTKMFLDAYPEPIKSLDEEWLEEMLDILEHVSIGKASYKRFPYSLDAHDKGSYSDGGDYYYFEAKTQPGKDAYSQTMSAFICLRPELMYRTHMPDKKTLAAFFCVLRKRSALYR